MYTEMSRSTAVVGPVQAALVLPSFCVFISMQWTRAQRWHTDLPLVKGFPPFIPLIQLPSWPCCVFYHNSLLQSHCPQCYMDLMRHNISHTFLTKKPTVSPAVDPHCPQSGSSMFYWLYLQMKFTCHCSLFHLSVLRIPSRIMMIRFCNLEGYNYHTPSV